MRKGCFREEWGLRRAAYSICRGALTKRILLTPSQVNVCAKGLPADKPGKRPAMGLVEVSSPWAHSKLNCKEKLPGETLPEDKPGKRPALELAEVPAPEEFCKLHFRKFTALS